MQKYCSENYIYKLLIHGLLFSSRITNEASIVFIACNALTNAFEAIIHGKPYKSLGLIYINEIEK